MTYGCTAVDATAAAEHPAERDLHEAKHEPFHRRGVFQTEIHVGGYIPDEPDVEVADEGGKYHEDSVSFHEGEQQAVQLVVDVELVGLATLHCLRLSVLHRQSALQKR